MMLNKLFIFELVLFDIFILTLSASTFQGFYYGDRVFSDAQLSIAGIDKTLPNFISDKTLSLNFNNEFKWENRQRDFYNNYNTYIGRNKYASYNNTEFNFNSFAAAYNNFTVIYNRERDCNYKFIENVYDISEIKIKENEQSSSGGVESYNLYYKLNLFHKSNMQLYAGLNYNKFKNEISINENFISNNFTDYLLESKYDGDGWGLNLLYDYEYSKKNKFILFYKSVVEYKGDYTIFDNTGLSKQMTDKKIKFPCEIDFIAILTLPSEHFTKLCIDINYVDWDNLKDDDGFLLPSKKSDLKSIFIYSLGIKYKLFNKWSGGFSIYYEPSYNETKYKKIGLNFGAKYNLTDKFDIIFGINYFNFLFKEDYPFTLQPTGTRMNRIDRDYSENNNLKLNFGFEYKL